MKTPKVHISKLGDQSKQMINLGREPGTKAYRLYDPVCKKINVSRDVVFDEAATWSWLQHEEYNDQESNSFSVSGEFGTETGDRQEHHQTHHHYNTTITLVTDNTGN